MKEVASIFQLLPLLLQNDVNFSVFLRTCNLGAFSLIINQLAANSREEMRTPSFYTS